MSDFEKMKKVRELIKALQNIYCLAMVSILISITTINAQNSYVEKEIWINNGSRRIYGILATPENTAAKYPLAIIAHGFNGNHRFAPNYFKELCALGYGCYSFDFPCGSLKNRSDTNTMNMSVIDEKIDITAIVKYFKSMPDIDADSIVLIGESQGGLAAALAAADIPNDIAKLVLVYPAFCIPDNWLDHYRRESDIPDTTFVWGVPLGRRFFEEVREVDVDSTMMRYKREVLIVHGDKDSVVPLDYSRRALCRYPNARLKIISGAGHGFKGDYLDEFCKYLRSFLQR